MTIAPLVTTRPVEGICCIDIGRSTDRPMSRVAGNADVRPYRLRSAERIMGRMNTATNHEEGPLGAGSDLVLLDSSQILELLSSRHLGRLAFAHERWPVIVPVNYAFDEPNIFVRTAPGAKLTSAPLHMVAFEVDDSDPEGRWDWSVLVQGPAFDITSSLDQCSQSPRRLLVEPAAPGVREHWLMISALHISGRAFGAIPGFPQPGKDASGLQFPSRGQSKEEPMNDLAGYREILQRSVDSLPLQEVVSVASGASIGEVAKRMREEDVSSVLVGEEPRRFVTERDLTRALADGLGPDQPVEAIAERTPFWVVTNSQVVDVAQMMLRHWIRHMVVLNPSGEVAGIVSMRDVFALLVPPMAVDAASD